MEMKTKETEKWEEIYIKSPGHDFAGLSVEMAICASWGQHPNIAIGGFAHFTVDEIPILCRLLMEARAKVLTKKEENHG